MAAAKWATERVILSQFAASFRCENANMCDLMYPSLEQWHYTTVAAPQQPGIKSSLMLIHKKSIGMLKISFVRPSTRNAIINPNSPYFARDLYAAFIARVIIPCKNELGLGKEGGQPIVHA